MQKGRGTRSHTIWNIRSCGLRVSSRGNAPCQYLFPLSRFDLQHFVSVSFCRGNKVIVHRFKPAVEILVPLWKAGLEAGQPSEVRSAWIEIWGVDEVSG